MQSEHFHLDINREKIWVKRIRSAAGEDIPTVVLLHDALGSVAQWKDFPERIAEQTGYPVLAYDRVGHGLSSPRRNGIDPGFLDREALVHLPEILHQLKIDKPVLYGHSDGGTIAIIYAARIRTRGLILEAAHILTEEKTREGVLQTTGERDHILPKLRKYHGEKALPLFSDWAGLWSGKLMVDWNIGYLLDRIDCPTLLLQGLDDNYATEEQVKQIEKGLKGPARVTLLESCGHSPHREKADLVLEEIRSFLESPIGA